MNCPKCGTQNLDTSKFCVKCGEPLVSTNNNSSVSVESINNAINNNQTNGVSTANNSINNTVNTTNTASLNYFAYFIAVILKPHKTFKEEESKLSNPKTSILLSVIVTGIMTLITLLASIISVIFVKSYDLNTFKTVTKISFDGLKNLNYVSLIFKNFLIYIGIIFAIAGVYYIASLIFKKSINFMKQLAITATAIIPLILSVLLLAPILSKIWIILSVIVSIVGVLYTLFIYFNLVDSELTFDNVDTKIYFHLICCSVILIAFYFLSTHLIVSSLF